MPKKIAIVGAGWMAAYHVAGFRSAGAEVATVDQGNKVRLQKVIIQRDLGTELEVASGLTGDERVIVNPPDSLSEGQSVRVVENR